MTGGASAGSSTTFRLDPDSLPLNGEAISADCDGFYLDREKAVMRHRTANGSRTITVPVSAYDGVAVRIDTKSDPALLVVELAHRDKALNLPLARSGVPEDVADDWQAWSRMLDLPLMVVMPDGSVTRYRRSLGEAATMGGQRQRANVLPLRGPTRRQARDADNVIRVDFQARTALT